MLPSSSPLQSLDPETLAAASWRRWAWPLVGLALVAVAGGLWCGGRSAPAAALAGALVLSLAFVAGIAALRLVLSGSHGVVGVARAVVEEAIGSRTPMLLVLTLVLGLPVLPLVLDPSERLEYRLQFFLNWSLSGASFLLAMITIVLAVGSVCGDIDSQRIHMTLVKPIQRWQYLLGKWSGIVLLDLVLVGIVGVGVFLAALAIGRLPAADAADRRAVDEQVFTARQTARPEHPQGAEFDAAVTASIEQMRKDDPAGFALDPAGASRRIRAQRVLEWHTISADVMASYLFTLPEPSRIGARVVQLRLKPFAENVGIDRAPVRFALWLNDRAYPLKNGVHEEYTLTSGRFHTIDIPVTAIDESGLLRVAIANRNLVPPGETRPTAISFSPGKGLEVLYRAGTFSGNFVRGLVVMLAKLAMLAAAALAAASWLGFPIAVLASLMVYVVAVARGFLADAIDIYTGLDLPDSTLVAMVRLRVTLLLERLDKLELWDACKTLTSIVADAFLALVPSFGAHDGVTEVATGRLLSPSHVLLSCGELAVLYPLLLLAVGWLLLERRDLVNSSGS
jgi:hypothetical protein